MAKACAYLCRQRCFIDGFGEFGEIFGHCFEPTLGGGLTTTYDVHLGLIGKRIVDR